MKELAISPDGFMNMLAMQNGGAIVAELNREMNKGVEAVLDNGGNSTITLKIKIERVKNLDSAMTVTPSVTVKHPKEKPQASCMFLTPCNGLSEHQQDQHTMELGDAVQSTGSKLTPVSEQ